MAATATAPEAPVSSPATATPSTGTSAPAANSDTGHATDTSGTGTRQATAPANADTATEATFFDRKSIEGKPELEAGYKEMQRAFTKAMQGVSKDRDKIEAFNAFNSDPIGSMQRFAKQYGYSLSRAEAAAAVNSPANAGTGIDGWEPKTWGEVLAKAEEVVMSKVQQQFKPMVDSVQKVTANNIEHQLNGIDENWRVYEDTMRENLKTHPTLVNDVSMLYRLSVPQEVLEGRAVQTALRKLEDKAKGAQLHGSQNTSRSTPAPKKVTSFQEAVEAAKASASGR